MIFITYILAVVILTYYGNKKGHGTNIFIISLLLSPLIGFFVLLAVRDKTIKQCTECAEKVNIDAKFCRFCGHVFKT